MSTFSRQSDLLKQPLLKGLGTKLDRTEHDDRAGARGNLHLSCELLPDVGDEVAAVPIAFEDGNNFVDDVRIARRRHPDVHSSPLT